MTPPIDPGNRHFLVVVADESKAVIYRRDKLSGPLQEIATFQNEAARQKTGDILADKGGRSFDSHGQGRHTMAGDRDAPQQQVARAFAKDIAEIIAAESHKGTCRGYAVIAAPRFLGLLRQEFSTAVRQEPYASVDKDVVGQDESVIENLLENA